MPRPSSRMPTPIVARYMWHMLINDVKTATPPYYNRRKLHQMVGELNELLTAEQVRAWKELMVAELVQLTLKLKRTSPVYVPYLSAARTASALMFWNMQDCVDTMQDALQLLEKRQKKLFTAVQLSKFWEDAGFLRWDVVQQQLERMESKQARSAVSPEAHRGKTRIPRLPTASASAPSFNLDTLFAVEPAPEEVDWRTALDEIAEESTPFPRTRKRDLDVVSLLADVPPSIHTPLGTAARLRADEELQALLNAAEEDDEKADF